MSNWLASIITAGSVFIGAMSCAHAHDIIEVEARIKRAVEVKFRIEGTASPWMADVFAKFDSSEAEAGAAAMRACQDKLKKYRESGLAGECVLTSTNYYRNHRHD